MENRTFKVLNNGVEIDKVRVLRTIENSIIVVKVNDYGDPDGGRLCYNLNEAGITIQPWIPKSKQEKHNDTRFEPLVPVDHGVLGIIKSPDPDYSGLWVALKMPDGSIREYVCVEENCNTHDIQVRVYTEQDYDDEPVVLKIRHWEEDK